jgi:hypothetical protein
MGTFQEKLSLLLLFLAIIGYPLRGQPAQSQQAGRMPILSPTTQAHFLPAGAGEGAKYYVSPTGSDGNPGTFRLPWKTIGKATQAVRPGDRVILRGGLYKEAVNLTTSGTVSQPIQITAYPGETPVIDGEFSRPGYWGSLVSVTGDYVHLSGIEVRNSAYMCVYVYGSHVVVDGIYAHHCKENGILITHGQYSTVENSRVWKAAMANEFAKRDDWASGLSTGRQGVTFATIRNNTVWESWGEGISSYEADQVTIENNIAYDNYTANIYISDSTNVLCQGNFVYTNPASDLFDYGPHVGIMLGDERYKPPSSDITVINNIAYGNNRNFYWWRGVQGGGMQNVLIANNTFVNSIHRSGVMIAEGDHQNVRFTNNIIQQDGLLPVILAWSHPEVAYSFNLWSKIPLSLASGPGDVIGDPKLTETGKPFSPAWFEVTALSPAWNKAQVLPEVELDFYSSTRDKRPDMGALEYLPRRDRHSVSNLASQFQES